jgi:transcriptional/translational regulatory protein YebC/TACO1
MFCSVESLGTSANALTARGLTVREQHIVYEPQTLVDCSSDAQQTIMLHKMLDVLDDNDDVQNVFHNADLPDEDE